MQIHTTDQVGTQNGIKCLVYGKAGVGKTMLCATAPSPFIISAENGLLSLSGHRIPYVNVKNARELEEVYKWLHTSPDAAHIQTICIDSLSEIAEVVLQDAKTNNKHGMQAYGALIDELMPLVRKLRDFPGKHVVITSKQEYIKDEVTGVAMFGPSAPGKELPKAFPYLVDELFHMGIGRDPKDGRSFRYLRTQPDFQYEAKDRSGKLAEIEYPDLNAIFNKIKGA